MNESWVKLYHTTLDSAVMQDDWHFRLFVWCLLKANYKPSGFRGQDLQPGQFITGRVTGAEALNVSPSKFYRGLLTLQNKYESITIKANSQWTTVTICNWDTYQSSVSENGDEVNNERTTNEQPVNNERTTNEHILRSKEGKKDRKIEGKSGEPKPRTVFVPPTVDEVGFYCAERNNSVDAERFVDFYQSKGWMVGKNKMKDWRAAVHTWEKTARPSKGEPDLYGGIDDFLSERQAV